MDRNDATSALHSSKNATCYATKTGLRRRSLNAVSVSSAGRSSGGRLTLVMLQTTGTKVDEDDIDDLSDE